VGYPGGKQLMKMLAYIMAVVCVMIAATYFTLPRESLPTFLPGYLMGADRVYYLHGVAALIGAVIFVLIGLSVTPASRE
jgi:CRISPR/Cas system-associated protein Csm6